MTVNCKFDYEQHVRHRLNEFEGFITGIVIRPTSVEYEVLPVTDDSANWREAIWINEKFLEACGDKRFQQGG